MTTAADQTGSVRELQAEERSQADRIAEYAAATIYGVSTRDRLHEPEIVRALEGGAMSLVRRIQPAWMQAAHEQAVDTLLQSDEYRALMRGRGLAESRLIAHRLVTAVRAALIGVLENERSARPETYLKLQAAAMPRAEAR